MYRFVSCFDVPLNNQFDMVMMMHAARILWRENDDNWSQVRWWAFCFVWLLKRFQNSVCYFSCCITCFCHGVVYFCELLVCCFWSAFHKFNGDLPTSKTFVWVPLGYFWNSSAVKVIVICVSGIWLL